MKIKNSLVRIEKALDLRFEKDSSLYISKEDTEKLKEYLHRKQNQNIDALVLKLGNKVVSNIVLKNSYLIDINDRKLKSSLEKLFKSLDKYFFVTISRNIVEDRVFSTIEFKEFLERLFFKEVDLGECAKNYQDTNEKVDNRAICFARYVSEDYALKNSSANLVRFIDEELGKYPDIASYFSSRDQRFLERIFSVSSEKADIAKWIIKYKLNSTENYWINGLNSLGSDAFEQMINHVKSNPQYDNEITKKICSRFFRFFYKSDDFAQSISSLFLNYKDIRFHLVNMFEPNKFKDKEIALKILGIFKNHASSHPKLLEKISKLEAWDFKEVISLSAQSLLDDISNQNKNLSDIRTLTYYYNICYNNHDSAIFLYYNHKSNIRVIEVLSFYFSKSLSNSSFDCLRSLSLDDDYVKKIGDWVRRLSIRTHAAKLFLETYKRYDVLEELFHKR